MVLQPSDLEGRPENRHRRTDQWLFNVAGKGVATVNNRKIELEAGTMLVIEASNGHEIPGCVPPACAAWLISFRQASHRSFPTRATVAFFIPLNWHDVTARPLLH